MESAEDTNSEDGLAAGFDSQRGTKQPEEQDMSYIITIRTGPRAEDIEHFAAIGNLAELIDAAYDDGALGVTAMVRP